MNFKGFERILKDFGPEDLSKRRFQVPKTPPSASRLTLGSGAGPANLLSEEAPSACQHATLDHLPTSLSGHENQALLGEIESEPHEKHAFLCISQGISLKISESHLLQPLQRTAQLHTGALKRQDLARQASESTIRCHIYNIYIL